jgi:hypothetical protein
VRQQSIVRRRRLTKAFWILLLVWMAVIGLAFTGLGGRDSLLTSVSTAFSVLIPVLALVVLWTFRRDQTLDA